MFSNNSIKKQNFLLAPKDFIDFSNVIERKTLIYL
jgi:hypothetical protein